MSDQQERIDSLEAQLHELEVAANTVAYCYDRRPENFALALTSLEREARYSRMLLQGESRD